MEREDGLLVCRGTGGVGSRDQAALQTKDLRACEPDELRVLNKLRPGLPLGSYDVLASTEKQFQRYDTEVISDPLPWYREESPWGDVLAVPCTILEFLWAYPMQGMRPLIGDAVGLFGAIEIGFEHGPFIMNRNYRIESEVVCVGQSPKTEFVWYRPAR